MHVLVVEDRASAAFWEWQRALWQHSVRPLEKIASGAFCRHFEGAMRLLKRFFMEVSIDRAEVEEFRTEKGWDLVRTRIDWCGRSGQGEEKDVGRMTPISRSDYFHMARRSGVRTDRKQGLCSLRCWSCGAPFTDRTGWKCSYCGSVLNDGSHDWMLAHVTPGRGRAHRR